MVDDAHEEREFANDLERMDFAIDMLGDWIRNEGLRDAIGNVPIADVS
jgi:hypothetical protein